MNLGGIQLFGGAAMTLIGSSMEASAYRAGGAISAATARYNADVLKQEYQRQINALARQTRSVLATQHVQGVTQHGSGSRSALAFLSDTMHKFELKEIDMRNTMEQRQQQVLYEGQVAQWQAKQQARSAMTKGIMGAFSSLTSLF